MYFEMFLLQDTKKDLEDSIQKLTDMNVKKVIFFCNIIKHIPKPWPMQ